MAILCKNDWLLYEEKEKVKWQRDTSAMEILKYDSLIKVFYFSLSKLKNISSFR